MLGTELPFRGSTADVASRRRRALLLFVSIILHLLFLLLLWMGSHARPKSVARVRQESLLTLALPNTGGQPLRLPNRPSPTPIPPAPLAVTSVALAAVEGPPSLVTTNGAAAKIGVAGGCALPHDAAVAIGQDAAAMTEVNALPPDMRTSADAIMLWDGRWTVGQGPPTTMAGAALRRVVERVVAEASVECRDAKANGPEFIPVPDGDRTIMIVIGSGAWRWADLLVSPVSCTPSALTPCFTVPPFEILNKQ